MKDEKRIEKPRKPSSPRTHHMPDLIPDTPENIARALLNRPPEPPGGAGSTCEGRQEENADPSAQDDCRAHGPWHGRKYRN